MTSDEIKAMPVEEVYRKVAEILWPWDESRCRVCGWTMGDKDSDCKPGNCRYIDSRRKFRADDSSGWNLQSWDGVGRMVEAMRQRGWAATIINAQTFVRVIFWDLSANLNSAKADTPTPWESCARACLLALAESETSI